MVDFIKNGKAQKRIWNKTSGSLLRHNTEKDTIQTTHLVKTSLSTFSENFNVIFIGYGLNEERVLSSIPVGSRKKHFWLKGLKRNNIDDLEIRSTILKNYNIQPIPYCIDREGPEILNNVFGLMYSASSEKGGMKGG